MTHKPQCPDEQVLRDLLEDHLPDQQQTQVAAHLETCIDCQTTLEELAAGAKSWNDLARHLGQQKPGAEEETALHEVVRNLSDDSCDSDLRNPFSPPGKRGRGEGVGTNTPYSPLTPNPSPPEGEREAGHALTPNLSPPEGRGETNSSTNDAPELDILEPPRRADALGRLKNYDILAIIGRGGMGVVLKAFDSALHRMVAIKVLAPHLASSENAVQRFLREARSAAAVVHENIVTIHAVDQAGRLPYLVMQLITGPTLEEHMRQKGRLETTEIVRLGAQIAAGLAAAHAQGRVHRDIKPGNILLEGEPPRVKITDFGLARAADDVRLTQSGAIAGTPLFMSPEQARGEPVDHRSDLFSLGSVLYLMASGRPPFRGETTMAVLMNVSTRTPASLHDLNPDLPEDLVQIIDRLMAKNPNDRFQTAQEVSDMLLATLTRLPHPGAPTTALPPRHSISQSAPRRTSPKPISPLIWLIIPAVFVLLALGLIVTELTGLTNFSAALFSDLQPEAPTVLKKFNTDDKVLTKDGVTAEKDHWVIKATGDRTVKLFEVAKPGVEKCTVYYHAKMKTENVTKKAYLEMWCHFPGKGEFFSKGLAHPATGTTDWATYEIPFFLKEGESPDLIKLNVAIEGGGTVMIKDIELSKGPLPR